MENVFSWKIGLFLQIYCSCIRTHLAVWVMKVKQVEGPIVSTGAMGIPILSHIVKNSSKYILHISNVGAKIKSSSKI
jgi:hypothetical protein